MQESGAARRGERAGCRKLEGRRSRPGLVLGLADSLALSQRNASNAGEPLLSPSLLTPHRFLLALILGTFLCFSFSVSILLDLALSSSLFPPPLGPPFHSVHSLLRCDGKERRRRTLHRIPRCFFICLSLFQPPLLYDCLFLTFRPLPFCRSVAIKFCVFQRASCGIRKRNATIIQGKRA